MPFRSVLLSIVPFLLLAAAAIAAPPVAEVARDFQSLPGVVLARSNGEFLLDLDAGRGVAPGDLFAVIEPGEKIVHPRSGEVVGSLEKVKGLLQATLVKDGYSHARPVQGLESIRPGDAVRRFDGLPAVLWDYTGSGEAFFAELKAALPALAWQDYRAAQAVRPDSPGPPPEGVLLVFVLKEEGLEVRDFAFEMLRSYPHATPSAAAGILPPAPSAAAIVQQDLTGEKGVWIGPTLRGEAVGVEVADLDGDGRQEVILAFSHRLEVGRLEQGQYAPLASLDLGSARRAVALDGADLDGDGKPELYVTAGFSGDLDSLVVVFEGGVLRVVQEHLPWYFRSVPLPGDERVLLAQRQGSLREDFGGPVFRVHREEGRLRAGEPLDLPASLPLYGFVPFPVPGEERLFARLSTLDFLQVVSAAGTKLWESDERFGGSEAYLEREDPATSAQSGDNIRFAYLPARLELGGKGEILVPVNEGSRLLARQRSFKKSRLRAMVWRGEMLREAWHTLPQDGYLADFRLADADNDGVKEVVMVLVFSGKGFSEQRRSALAVFELP